MRLDPLSKSTYFLVILMLHLSSRNFIRFLERGHEFRFYLAAGFICCFLGMFSKELRRWATIAATVLGASQLALVFPVHSNHFFLEFTCLLFFGIAACTKQYKGNEQAIQKALLWMLALLFVGSGVQKLLHGTYFTGTFLAHAVSQHDRFDPLFRILLSNEEFTALNTGAAEAFRFHSWSAVVVSNLVWITEIIAGVLILVKPYKRIGLISVFIILIAIEVLALELMFGLLVLNLILVCWPWKSALPWRIALPSSAILYCMLIATKLGILSFQFHA